MPTKKSETTMKSRRKNSNMISFLTPKGGKWLVKALALRGMTTITDAINHAILTACGLRVMPSAEALADLVDVKTQKAAISAISRLQELEDDPSNESVETWNDEHENDVYKNTLSGSEISAFLDVADQIAEQRRKANESIRLTGTYKGELNVISLTARQRAILLRALSNITVKRTS